MNYRKLANRISNQMSIIPGNSFPGTNNLSTPSFVMTAIRITPPEDPSRDIANAKAMYNK